MFDSIENRIKVKAFDQMTEIWNRYLYVMSDEGFEDYRQRFRDQMNGSAWTEWYANEDDEECNIGYLLWCLENPGNNFNWLDYTSYYLSIISFDTETNREKVATFDKMIKLYQEYKNNMSNIICDSEDEFEGDYHATFKHQLIILLTGKEKPESVDEMMLRIICGRN